MSMMSPDMPEAPNPAKRPERKSTINPEDITVSDSEQSDESEERGRRALRRPSGTGSTGGTGNNVGTGLNA